MLSLIPVLIFVAVAMGLAAIATLVATFFTVEQRTTAIVQRFGKFVREAEPGLRVKVPFIDRVIGRMNLRVQQLDVEIETKTEDNVFVQMVVAVQYYVLPEKVYDAFYKLDDATRQITSFVFDVVRARVPKIKLDYLSMEVHSDEEVNPKIGESLRSWHISCSPGIGTWNGHALRGESW